MHNHPGKWSQASLRKARRNNYTFFCWVARLVSVICLSETQPPPIMQGSLCLWTCVSLGTVCRTILLFSISKFCRLLNIIPRVLCLLTLHCHHNKFIHIMASIIAHNQMFYNSISSSDHFSELQLPIYVICAVLSHVQLFATPRTVAHQAPLSIGFSK